MKKKRSAGAVYRDRKQLVIREGARLPDRCVICNKEDDVEHVDFFFSREKLRYVELAAVQSVANAASDLAKGARYTGPVQTEIPLCAWHRGRRIRLLGIGVGMAILGVLTIVIQKAMGKVIVPHGELGFLEIALHNWIAIAAVCIGIAFVMMCIFDSSKLWFKPTKYYDRFVWITGAGAEFLKGLPAIESKDYKVRTAEIRCGGDEANLSAEELIRRAGLDDE